MELPKLIILLCCTTIGFASHHTHVIPVEGYETELQNLGEHVEIPETPVKVVRITKTIAVKIPVPYPVKVIEKVPYPVHVNKPYPVPVPQIVKVPVAHHHHGQEPLDVSHGNHFQDRQHNGNSYQVQEHPHNAQEGSFDGSTNQSHEGENYGNSAPNENYSSEGSPEYGQQAHDFHGSAGDQDGHNSFESKSYDLAIQNYLKHLRPNGNYAGHEGAYH
ncbi:uncharacterized protein LOC120637302 [Pararge aegeria]|uniref:Jg13260 protein n=1 Tax=Pararge aegeria aegeria TaxID=348720 RepID=A0A8S4S7U6_9NEOP|nr:uncharacterized protein LOC120637302 [Pararge aegeria]CAH2247004.1 jg13260 [Pararge aegeria aegeria]